MRGGLKNKRLWINLFITVAVATSVILTWLMHKYVGEIRQVYVPEEDIYALAFNIGFRWSSLLGMVAIVLFQTALYISASCEKKYFYEILVSGIWGANAIIFPLIESSSRIYFYLRLRDDYGYDLDFGFYRVWNYMGYGINLIVAVLVIRYFYKWLFYEESSIVVERKTHNKWNLLALIMGVIGSVLLVIRSFTNIWYILLCAGTIAVSWFVLKKVEVLWIKLGLDKCRKRDTSLIDKVLVKLSLSEPDDYDDEIDEFEAAKYTLDLLIMFYETLEKEPFSDNVKKEYMIRMIRKMRTDYNRLEATEEENSDGF